MKTILKNVFLLTIMFILFNCNNDDGNAPNENTCNFEDLTADINGTITLIPEPELKTDYFSNNDGLGKPAVEVFYTTKPGSTFIVL